MLNKLRVLFLSTNNSCRSQMAEGFAMAILPTNYQLYSAGILAGKIDEKTIRVMAEVGIDLTTNYSKTIDSFTGIPMNYVVSMSNFASENIPIYSATSKIIHKYFENPYSLANLTTNTESQLDIYRQIRNEIKNYIYELQEILEMQNTPRTKQQIYFHPLSSQ